MVFMETFVKGYVAGMLIQLENWLHIPLFPLFCSLSARHFMKY